MASPWLDEEVGLWPNLHDVHQVFASDGTTAVWLRVARFSTGAWFQAALLRSGQQSIVLAEEDIPHPGIRWELRSSGLWADHNCETPLEHWSYGLEAFALALEDPEQLVREGVGDRVPIGWELDFEAEAGATPLDDSSLGVTAPSSTGYSQRGHMHGLLLTKQGESEFEAPAIRHHWWGEADAGPRTMNLSATPPLSGAAQSVLVPVGSDIWSISLDGNAQRVS